MELWLCIVVLLILAGLWYLLFVHYAGKVPQPFKFLIQFLLIGAAIYLVLTATGLWDKLRGIKVPHV